MKTHLVDEAIGYIWIWFHAEGEEPTYRIPRLPEIHEQNWKYMGRTEHYVNVHIQVGNKLKNSERYYTRTIFGRTPSQVIPENVVDTGHFNAVHRPIIGMGNDLRKAGSFIWNVLFHTWNATWIPLPHSDEHIGRVDVVQKLSVFEKFFTMTVNGKMDIVRSRFFFVFALFFDGNELLGVGGAQPGDRACVEHYHGRGDPPPFRDTGGSHDAADNPTRLHFPDLDGSDCEVVSLHRGEQRKFRVGVHRSRKQPVP